VLLQLNADGSKKETNTMENIKELMQAALIRAAIEILIERKYQLDEAYNNGLIGYFEYEQIKAAIEADLNSISPEIPIT
jgi:hypothetical protein